MSDEGQDVAINVVSTALPCCFSRVLPGAKDLTRPTFHSSSPAGPSLPHLFTSYEEKSNVNSSTANVIESVDSDVGTNLSTNVPTDAESSYATVVCVHDTNQRSKKSRFPNSSSRNDCYDNLNEAIYNNKQTYVHEQDDISFDELIPPGNDIKYIGENVCPYLPNSDLASEYDSAVHIQCIKSLNENDHDTENILETGNIIALHDYCSTSTDATLQNSEESSEEESDWDLKQKTSQIVVTAPDKMGNKQSNKSKIHSDEDTPEEGRTKCCEIPKRKGKERAMRTNRYSRNDDLNFESNEVYPFEGRTRSEQELNEPVELEPFEIVETDDIKFVSGAGTSDVIKSVSEPKFTSIPEEPPFSDEVVQAPTAFTGATETAVQVPFYIDKGNRIVEPGTSTAHSTFEFRPVKQKTTKVSIIPSENTQYKYENVTVNETFTDSKQSGPKTSTSSSKSSSSASSKDISRKNSKEAMQKPARKGKSTANVVPEGSKCGDSNNENKDQTKLETSEKQQSVRDSEIDRNIDSVLMLTQTMFSNTKIADTQTVTQNKDIAVLNKYENVNVCAKMEPTGITICHKDVPLDLPTEARKHTTSDQTTCKGNNCEPIVEDVPQYLSKDTTHKMPQLASNIVEISESGTLIVKSLADLPSAKRPEDYDTSSSEHTYEHNDELESEDTDVKVPYETVDHLLTDIKTETLVIENTNKIEDQQHAKEKQTLDCGLTDSRTETLAIATPNKSEDKELAKEKEHVPPPSPLAMACLVEEEDEEEEDEDVDNEIIEEDRRKSEIIEFTENVCKRLSLLLEGMPAEETKGAENEMANSSEQNSKTYEDHIYETIDGKATFNDIKPHLDLSVLATETAVESNETDSSTLDCKSKLTTRSESSSTLKRASVDSDTYKAQEKLTPSISDDDLPDYFDPRDIPPPKRDSELICDVLDSNVDDVVHMDELSISDVSNIMKSNELDFEGLRGDSFALENKDKDHLSLPLKTFETSLITDTPSPSNTEDLQDRTPTTEAQPNLTPLPELAKAEEETLVLFDTSGRRSVTCTESDLDISEHRDDLSTDSMLADDEAEETMEILFTKTYTEPVEGAEVFLSCTVVNSAYKEEQKKSDTWLSDEAIEYFEANASEVMSTAFLKAKREMKDIQICIQSLRQQMEHFHSDCDDISLPEIPVDSLSPDYFGLPMRKAVTD